MRWHWPCKTNSRPAAWSLDTTPRPSRLQDERYDILVIDENFQPTHSMLGSSAIRELRQQFAGREHERPIIISCTGSADDYAMTKKKAELLSIGADAVWPKPIPDWRNGVMQQELTKLFMNHGRAFHIASDISSVGAQDLVAQDVRVCRMML